MDDRAPYSYREDPAVPAFDDSRPVFVFDGTCALCSGGAAWLMRQDRRGKVRFASAQSPLGRALYAHCGIAIDETYLLVADGRILGKSRGYLELCAILGGWWNVLRFGAVVPERVRDRLYGWVAANRYRWFGRTGQCALLSEEQRMRLL